MLSLFAAAGPSLTTVLTLWLAAGALGLAIVAVTFSVRPEPTEDLDKLHRTIDLIRAQMLEADLAGRPIDSLYHELRVLVARLPKDDARRRLPRRPGRRLS